MTNQEKTRGKVVAPREVRGFIAVGGAVRGDPANA